MENLRELSLEELREINGGGFWAGVAAGMIGMFLYEVVNDWDNNVKAFREGYDSFR